MSDETPAGGGGGGQERPGGKTPRGPATTSDGNGFAGEVITSLVETGDQIVSTGKVIAAANDKATRANPALAAPGTEEQVARRSTQANPALRDEPSAQSRSDRDAPPPALPQTRTEAMIPLAGDDAVRRVGAGATPPPERMYLPVDGSRPPASSYARTDQVKGRQVDGRWEGYPEIPAVQGGGAGGGGGGGKVRRTLEQEPDRRFAVPLPRGMTAPTEPRQPPARPWAWWRQPRDGRLPMNPASRLTHHVAYEVIQAVTVAAWLTTLAFAVLGGQFGDLYIKLRGTAPVTGHVTLLTIGDEALYLLDPEDPAPATTPRTLLAELVRFLDEAGAAVIVLDLLLDTSAAGDDELARAASAHGAVVSAERFSVTDPSSGREFVRGTTPALVGAIDAGFANFQQEQTRLFTRGDMLVRRAPLVRRVARASLDGGWPGNMDGSEQTDGEVRPSLALLAAWLYRARQADPTVRSDDLLMQLQQRCTGSPMRCDDDGSALGLPPLPGPLHEPLEINFRGPEYADGLPTISAARALRLMGEAALLRGLGVDAPMVTDQMRAALQDKIVVVCRVDSVARAAGDEFITPYAFPLMMGADMTGGRVQAQVIDTLLSGRHVRRVGAWLPLLLALLLAAAVVASGRVLRDDVHTVGWLVAAAAAVLAGAGLFAVTDGLVVGMGLPLAAILVTLTTVRVRGWARE